jgi:C_GCAxxG_C_C family probable redox protein
MTRTEDAVLNFADGFACAPAVFTAFGKEMGLTEDQCLKISCAFGGGMARNQYTCGAVTGALMVLGLHFGRGSEDGIEKKDITYEKSNEFLKEFTKRHGSIVCKELLQGLNMNDPQDKKKIEVLKLFQTVCVKYVQDAVQIVEQLIGE